MKDLLEKLKGKKSYFIMVATILYAVIIVGWQNGDWSTALELIWGALGFGALRAGISNSVK